jgi:hypothetical protein
MISTPNPNLNALAGAPKKYYTLQGGNIPLPPAGVLIVAENSPNSLQT